MTLSNILGLQHSGRCIVVCKHVLTLRSVVLWQKGTASPSTMLAWSSLTDLCLCCFQFQHQQLLFIETKEDSLSICGRSPSLSISTNITPTHLATKRFPFLGNTLLGVGSWTLTYSVRLTHKHKTAGVHHPHDIMATSLVPRFHSHAR